MFSFIAKLFSKPIYNDCNNHIDIEDDYIIVNSTKPLVKDFKNSRKEVCKSQTRILLKSNILYNKKYNYYTKPYNTSRYNIKKIYTIKQCRKHY